MKHIFTFICALLLAHVFVAGFHSEDMVFDPMDSEDSAVIKQNRNTDNGSTEYYNVGYSHKGTAGFYSEQKTSKKGKQAKIVAFKFIGCANNQVYILPVLYHSSAAKCAEWQSVYDYLYYREINPPPPKFC